MEKHFDFRKELITVHKARICDFSVTENEDDLALKDGLRINISENADGVVEAAAGPLHH